MQIGSPRTERPFVLIVGRDTPARARLVGALLDRGYATVLCTGPPGCVLAREESCVLVTPADVVVFLSTWKSRPATVLRECARSARRAVFVSEPPFPIPMTSVIVGSNDPEQIAIAVDATVRSGAA